MGHKKKEEKPCLADLSAHPQVSGSIEFDMINT